MTIFPTDAMDESGFCGFRCICIYIVILGNTILLYSCVWRAQCGDDSNYQYGVEDFSHIANVPHLCDFGDFDFFF